MSGIDNSYKMDGDVLLVISLFLSPLSLSSLAETAAERAREREIVAVLPPAPSPHQLPPFIKRETEREREEIERRGRGTEGGREVVCSCTLPEWRSRPKRKKEKKCPEHFIHCVCRQLSLLRILRLPA